MNSNCMVIDNSLFIKTFLEDEAAVLLLTFPSRFGKSVNLQMINCFLKAKLKNSEFITGKEKKENPYYKYFFFRHIS